MNAHEWFTGHGVAPQPPAPAGEVIAIDCHRRLRGPYSSAGTLLRVLVPSLAQSGSGLSGVHANEIVTIAPDLTDLVDAPPGTLTALATKNERTRLYARANTARLAHGVTDLLLAWAATRGPGLRLCFSHVDQADPADQEFLAILLRRARPGQIAIVVATSGEEVTGPLAAALRAHTRRTPAQPPAARPGRPTAELLHAYIDSDGTTGDPAEIAAYTDADPGVRAALHDQRAAALERTGDWSLQLGAIPYHLEHGTDRRKAVRVLREALDHCMFRGFYHAVVDFGRRGQAIGDPDDGLDYWYLAGRTAVAHAALDEPDQAEELFLKVRRGCVVPFVHMFTAYGLSMLYTRFRSPEQRDPHRAREYINNAIAIASWWPEPEERAFQTVFNYNGLALVEMHAGDLPRALQLVTDGLARLNRELKGTEFLLHRSVLIHNGANVLLRLDRADEALDQFSAAIEADPHYGEYYFDRAGVLRRLGRPADALTDYDTAIRLSLPYWEQHHNRGAVRAELGDLDGAVADFQRVVDLEPAQADAWISLVSLLLENGDLTAAAAGITEALEHHPGHPQLLCARAQLALEEGRADQAWRDFDLALAADGSLVAALAGRAALAYEAADHDTAIADLSRAIEMADDDPDLRYNRALLYQETGEWQAAISDYTHALDLPGADRGELLRQRDQCFAQLGPARADSQVTV